MKMSPSALTHSLHGTLLGTAVGDALGLPAEGMRPNRIHRLWDGDWRMRLFLGLGMLSDDTEHTFAVAQSLAEHPNDAALFQRALAARLRWWFLALPAGVGMATAKACIKLWLGISPGKSGVFSAGNGPAIRSALIGTFFHADSVKRREFVRASTRITHTDPKAEEAALAVAEAAAFGVNDGTTDEIVAALTSINQDSLWQSSMERLRVHLAQGSATTEFAAALGLTKGVSGYAFHTVPVALYAWLRHRDDFAKAITSALDCGGDTDTVGAIVGALAGTSLGPESIPAKWTECIKDWPLSITKLNAAAHSLAAGEKIPSLNWLARVLRNALFLCIVLAHGFRRLLPPY